MVTLFVDGKAVSWAEAEQLFADAGPADLIEIRNSSGRVLAVCEPVETPAKAVISEETARRMAGPFFTLEEMRRQLGWE